MGKTRFDDKRVDFDDEDRQTKKQIRRDQNRRKNKKMRNALRTCDIDELMELEDEDY